MIHMLSAFEMKPGEDEDAFKTAYAGFVQDLMADDLIVAAGPIGTRVSDTPMDTDDERTQTHYSVMSFRDRKQLNHAYAYLTHQRGNARGSHHDMYARITNSVFLCWQEQDQDIDKEN